MKKHTAYLILIFVLLTLCSGRSFAQLKDSVIDNIVREENENSQLTQLAHELFDKIGPRLVGTPQMEQANEWAVAKYTAGGSRRGMRNGVNGMGGRGGSRTSI